MNSNIFSALLHDIGKVYFRITGKNHKEATAEKIKKILDSKNEIFESILYTIKEHHNNVDDIVHVILSDYLSATERENLENQKEEDKDAKNKAILNPFDKEKYFPLSNLKEQFNIAVYFNNLIEEKKEKTLEEKNKLSSDEKNNVEVFEETIKKIFNRIDNLTKDEKNFIKNWLELLTLLEKLTAFIPSSAYKTEPTISLYDHLKMTGAIYYLIKNLDYDKVKKIIKKIKDNLKKEGVDYEKLDEETKNEKIGKFVILDISGIQNFIFNVYEKRKTVNFLKTRSLYLELLLFLIILNFFEKNRIPLTQILLSTAGKAELLLTEEEAKKLSKFIEKINKALFKKFKITLFIAYGSLDFKIKHLLNIKEFKKDLEKAEKEISKQKNTKFKEEIIEWNEKFINDFNNFHKFHKCEICYNFFEENEFVNFEKLKDKEKELYKNTFGDKKVCVYCWSLLKMGENLKILQKRLETKKEDLTFGDLLIDNSLEDNKNNNRTDKTYKVFEEIIDKEFLDKIKDVKISLDYYFKNKTEDNNNQQKDDVYIRFPFSLHFPLKEEKTNEDKTHYKIKTTEELAEKGDKTLPLALVTLDVDNLGKILYEDAHENKKAEEEKIKSPKWSKINFKSRLLNYFFSYYVPYLIKNNNDYRDFIYLIFSGGDDVLFFGRADVVLDFLIEIRKKFKLLFGNKITFSASYVLFKPKENLRNVADLAEDLLKEAKNKIEEKNVVNLNGVIISWNEILNKKSELDLSIDINNKVQIKEDIAKFLEDNNYFKFLKVTKKLFEISEKSNNSYKSLIYLVLRELNNLLNKDLEIDFMPFVRIQYYINRNINFLNRKVKDKNYYFTINYLINHDKEKLKDYINTLVENILTNNKNDEKEKKIKEIAYLLYFVNFIIKSYFNNNFEKAKEKLKNIINLIKLAENLY